MATAHVNSVVLTTPHVQITNLGFNRDYNWSHNKFTIWDDAKKETTPATIKLDDIVAPTLELSVSCSTSKNYDQWSQEWYICGNLLYDLHRPVALQSNPFKFDQSSPTDQVKKLHVKLPRASRRANKIPAPWGFDGTVEWVLVKKEDLDDYNDDDLSSAGKSELELYAIVADIAPAYLEYGIPMAMLQLFVLPAVDEGLFDGIKWANWVVKKCHASRVDNNERITIRKEDRIHSYKYDTVNGGSSFIRWGDDDDGRHFDLEGWLMGRENSSTINCYDQAHLVCVCLFLGFPYYFDKNIVGPGKYTISIWGKGDFNEKNSPPRFGFVKRGDLVGRGRTNDPFYTQHNRKIDQCLDDDTTRSDFGNHEWVAIRRTDVPDGSDNRYAADACAYSEIVWINKYLESAIDEATTLEIARRNDTNKLTGYEKWNLGTTNYHNWSTTKDEERTRPILMGTVTNISPLGSSRAIKDKSSVQVPKTVAEQVERLRGKSASVDSINLPAKEALISIMNAAKKRIAHSEFNPADIRVTTDHEITYLGGQLLHKNKDGHYVSILTVEITVLANFTRALDEMEQQVSFLNRHIKFEAMPGVSGSDLHLYADTGSWWDLIILSNVLVQLTATRQGSDEQKVFKDADIQELRNQLYTFCTKHTGALPPGSALVLSPEPPTSLKVDEAHDVVIESTKFAHINAYSKGAGLCIEQPIPDDAESPSKWTVHLKPNAIQGDNETLSSTETVTFYTADQGTYYPRQTTWEFIIQPNHPKLELHGETRIQDISHFAFYAKSTSQIKTLEVYEGKPEWKTDKIVVHGLRVVWFDGTDSKVLGKATGTPKKFEFEEHEKITSMTLWVGDRVDRITFKTDRDRSFEAGGTGGGPHELDVGTGVITGFEGGYRNCLWALGVAFMTE